MEYIGKQKDLNIMAILKMKKIIYKMRNMMKNKNDEDEIDFIELTFIHKMKIFVKFF